MKDNRHTTNEIKSSVLELQESISEHFLSSLKPITQTSYRNDLGAFSEFLGMSSINDMAKYFISLPHGQANLKAIEWRSSLKEASLAASTINRRLAALRSLVSFARMLGIVNWELEVKNLKATPYKNVRGPGQNAYERMLDYLDSLNTKQAKRDKAILVLFHDLGLRRAELSKLNYEDLILDEVYSIAVSGKGRDDKEILTIPLETFKSVKKWLEIRGVEDGPLFTSFDRAKKGSGRLTPNAIYERVKAIGHAIGIETHPHAIRHLAITEACKIAQAYGIGLEEILHFSRHKNVTTLMIYRDKERNVQGMISQLLAREKDTEN